jgi:hypothetical protein
MSMSQYRVWQKSSKKNKAITLNTHTLLNVSRRNVEKISCLGPDLIFCSSKFAGSLQLTAFGFYHIL